MQSKRPVNEDGTEATGWFCYYIWDKSGSSHDKPRWVNYGSHLLLDTEKEDLRDYVLYNLETWALHADRYGMDIFINVMPPAEVIEAECKNLRSAIRNKQDALAALETQLFRQRVLTNVQE